MRTQIFRPKIDSILMSSYRAGVKDLNYRATKQIQTDKLAAKFKPNRIQPLVDEDYHLTYRILSPSSAH
jgi:hypothetical protein